MATLSAARRRPPSGSNRSIWCFVRAVMFIGLEVHDTIAVFAFSEVIQANRVETLAMADRSAAAHRSDRCCFCGSIPAADG